MKRRATLLAALMAMAAASIPLFAAPTVSEKKDVAIFALGYYGFAIPQEALGNLDLEIQKVFVDLGRFNIIGVTQRLSSGGLQQFIDTLKKAKEANFVLPDKFQFGEAVMTEADFNKLLGAFIVAAPVIASFNSYWDAKNSQWTTEIKTTVTFIDVGGGGSTLGIASLTTTGTDKTNQTKSITEAINDIPMQLQYEIRKIPAFQINTRILAVAGGEVKLQLGQNMGIQKGDEYSVITTEVVEGITDQREVGLIDIKDVGTEISTGAIVYTDIPVAKDTQLREIPRLGVDADIYLNYILDGTPVIGLRSVVSRGFYGFRPYAALQIPLSQSMTFGWGLFTFIPISAVVGGEFNLNMGRISLTPFAGIGVSDIYVLSPTGSEQSNYISHVGAQAYLKASYLFSRDLKGFVEGGFEYWIPLDTVWFNPYGGLSVGAGVTMKL